VAAFRSDDVADRAPAGVPSGPDGVAGDAEESILDRKTGRSNRGVAELSSSGVISVPEALGIGRAGQYEPCRGSAMPKNPCKV